MIGFSILESQVILVMSRLCWNGFPRGAGVVRWRTRDTAEALEAKGRGMIG